MSEGPEQRFGRSLAFVVGIDAYSAGIPPLQSAVADATAVAEALRRDHSFETRCLFDHRAGLEDLLAVLADLSRELGPDDRILIYFAGHGVALDGDDGPAGYLLPATARAADRDSFLAMRVLHTELNKLAVRHALVILDCCFAGTFRWSSMRDVATDAPQVYRERYDRYVEAAAWQVLTSTSSRQLALDVLASDRGEQGCTHSPFARALLDGLAGAADYTADNLITASELAMFVRERVEPSVEATGRHQTPQLFTLDRHDHGEFVFQVPGGPLALPPAPTLTEDANPYRGLRSFLEADSDQFFGRGGITHQLVHSISERPLTVVVGPSGCGKSSVVHAGAVPALRANGWSVLATQRPASSPLRALAALAGELRGRPDILDAEPDIAWQEAVALRASEQPDRPWLVIIDQFEELITQRPPRGEYLAVLAALAFALRAAPSLHVVITVRSDVEPQFRESSLADWWSAGRIAIPGMTRDELQDAIERPAASRVLYFEPSRLVDRLIDDVALASAPLPLLSFALSELYRRCWTRWRGGGGDRALRESDYDAMGSVASALTHRATALHDELVQLSPAYGNTVRNVCIRIVAFVHGDLARRRVLGSELVYDDEAENHRVDLVLDRFHDARLISLGSQLTETGQPMSYAEPTHDELIRGWTKVREWLDELEHPIGTRAFVNAIGVATNAWIDSDRAPSYLWTDPRVELAQALHTGRPSLLNAAEAAFVGRSLRRRRSQRRRLVTSVVAVVAVLAVATGVALWQRDRAVSNAVENERLLAQSYQETGRQLVVAENPLQALPYLVAARKAGAAGIPLRTMFHLATRTLPVVTLAHDNAVSLAVYSPDGSLIATASADHRARIWNAATGALARCVLQHGDKVNSVAFSPDGTRLVTASEDGTAQIWDVASGRPLSPPLQHAAAVASAAFSPDGSRVVTASWDSTARVWEAATGLPVGRPIKHAQVVFAAVFSPDGQRIATANEGNTARIWDAATGEPRSPPLVHDNSVSSVAFSPDGTRVVTASQDHSARIWDAITGALIHELAHGRAVDAAVFNAQGTRVLTASSDETARIWNVATGALVHELKHKYAVVSAAFSPDGARVVTASADRSARIWDATTGKPLDGPLEHAGTVVSAAFSPDGAHVVTASDDRGARIWNATTGELQFYRLDHRGRVAAAFSPDGTRIVTTGSDHTVRVFSAATGLPLFPPLEHQASNVAARFSPDGTRILAVSQDNTARVWDAATGAPRGPALASPAGIWIAEFSPDGSRVVVASQDNRARVWDARTGALLTPAPLEHHGAVAFSRDGTRIATCERRDAVRVWDAATGKSVSPPLLHSGGIFTIAFSADGTRIVTGADHDAYVWDATSGALIAGPLHHDDKLATVVLSADNARVVTAGDDQTARIWDVATGRQLTLPLTHQAGLRSARFSQDGTRIVTTALDRTVRIWDATTGGLVVPPLEHPDSVLSAALSPDDTRVATISHDRSVRLWDATTGKLLAAPFEHPGALQGVAFSPGGAHLLVASDDGAHLRDVATDDQPLAAWQATAERGPYVLAGGVVAPRASLITASPSAQPAFSAGPTSSCPRPRSGQTAAIRP